MSHQGTQYAEASGSGQSRVPAITPDSRQLPTGPGPATEAPARQPHPLTNGHRMPQPPTPAPQERPSSAPGHGIAGARPDDDHAERAAPAPPRPSKPPLFRSKSEFAAARPDDTNSDTLTEELFEWGARHGFEDHYQSEDIISQLANVSPPPLSLCPNGS